MKTNKDYSIKLRVYTILNDSIYFWEESARMGKKVPCVDFANNKSYEISAAQYLVEIQEAVIIIKKDLLKMKRRAVFIKTIKSFLPW